MVDLTESEKLQDELEPLPTVENDDKGFKFLTEGEMSKKGLTVIKSNERTENLRDELSRIKFPDTTGQ